MLALIGDVLKRQARGPLLRAMLLMMVGTVGASALRPNTPVVILLTPIMIAASVGVAPSRLLIPLWFSAIFGGTLTLVGIPRMGVSLRRHGASCSRWPGI